MPRTPPDLLISYQLPLQEEAVQPFLDAVKVPGLVLGVEPRPPSGPFAGLLWLLPTAVFVWFGKSYFDSFLKEAGKDHYLLLKRGFSSLWQLFFGESRGARVAAVGTPGKIRPDDAKYSLGFSVLAQGDSGLHFKFLFPDDISAEAFSLATAKILGFLEGYYAGVLDVATKLQLGSARVVGKTILVTYDPDQDVFRFLDPIPNDLGDGK
jgi:hypothetical protein